MKDMQKRLAVLAVGLSNLFALIVKKRKGTSANTTPLNILIVAQGGFGGHHIEGSLKKELPDASVTMRKKDGFMPEDVKNYHIVIIAGYIEITGSRRAMVYNESSVLPDVAVFRNCTLCNHSRLLEFIYHPWP